MSDDKNGGSDLDIFEGLGKKGPASGRTSAVPPPPPGSGAHVAAKPGAELKKTLMGIPGPAQSTPSQSSLPPIQPAAPPSARPSGPPPVPSASGSMRAAAPAPVSQPPAPAASKPPPPPGRGSLPNLAATSPASQPPVQSATPSAPPRQSAAPVPAPASTRPTALASQRPSSSAAPAAPISSNGKLDMDWDDDQEATHVFDKESRDKEKAAAAATDEERNDRADMDAIMSSPPRTSQPPVPAAGTPPPPPPSTLSGAFGSLGTTQSNGSAPPSAAFRSGPPPSQSLRSAPPPPPVSQKNPSTTTAPVPPPPPPGQTTTSPMHMPPRPPSAPPPSAQAAQAQQAHAGGGMHQSLSNYPSAPPQAQQPAVAVQMPPVSRAPSPMEATALVPRPQQSKAGLMVALFLAVCAIVGIGVFFVMGRTGTLVVNVADSQGGAVQSLQVLVDGSKKCDSAPCILHDVPSGIHEVKVVADGYEPPAAKGVTVGRVDATVDFALVPAKGGQGGTGFKVTGNQPGVKLFVDGKEIGALPQEVKDLEPGDHQLHFVGSDRYAPLDKSVTVGKDEMVDIGNVALKVLKGKVTIQLGTPGAKVYLVNGANRKEVPQFPIAIDFDPNEKWQLEAKKDGYEPLVQPIRFDDGIAEKTINVVLSPKGSKAAAAPPSFAAAAPFAASAPAAPKAPVAKAEPKGETPSASEKPAKAEKPEKAAGGEALLNINSLPASTVVLDGKPLGPTPRVKVPVSPGTHTVLFVNAEQSLKKSITVTVGPGEMKAAFAKLRD